MRLPNVLFGGNARLEGMINALERVDGNCERSDENFHHDSSLFCT